MAATFANVKKIVHAKIVMGTKQTIGRSPLGMESSPMGKKWSENRYVNGTGCRDNIPPIITLLGGAEINKPNCKCGCSM